MHRYLALVRQADNKEGSHLVRALRHAVNMHPAEWAIAHDSDGLLVIQARSLHDATQVYRLENGSGVIIGRLFNQRHQDYSNPNPPKVRFDELETRKIVSTGGRHIIEQYWGSYAAFIADQAASRHHVFCDPTLMTPCYHTTASGADIFFSHIEDVVRILSLEFSINRDFIVRWFISSAVGYSETGLENVDELSAGEGVVISKEGAKRTLLWNPAELARVPRFSEPTLAAKELRSVVQNAINAWASCHSRITHHLSGGLDSSIVAGCLAHAPSKPEITYLNFSADPALDQAAINWPHVDRRTLDKIRAITGNGDERYFARLVAERWKTPLIEERLHASIDTARLFQGPLRVHPMLYSNGMQIDTIETALVANNGTQAFFSGEAGDSVFLASSRALSAIDHAYIHGVTRGLWAHVVHGCNLGKESFWTVLAEVARHGLLRRPLRPRSAPCPQDTVLRQELTATMHEEALRSTLDRLLSSSPLPPGKRNHARGLTSFPYHNLVFHSGLLAPHINPLNSQPVWELMLQIPTYTILTGGISRGLARRAFADVLPAQIRARQVKGTGTPLLQRIMRNHVDFVRSTLIDGLLVQQGYVDPKKITNALKEEGPSWVVDSHHLADCLAAEIWLRQWSDARQTWQHQPESAPVTPSVSRESYA